jgi:hypothetical protein
MMASKDIINLREVARSPCHRNIGGYNQYKVKLGVNHYKERHEFISITMSGRPL